MKKIVDGKLYDTETAELIHEVSPKSIFDTRKSLFETPRGNYFYVAGGLLGEDILVPLEEAKLLEWLERYGGEDVLLERFPEHVQEA